MRTDYYILNDPELSFQHVVRKHLLGEMTPKVKSEATVKTERPEDILRMDKSEILVKLEKGEGTLRIEKVGVKADPESPSKVKKEKDEVQMTLVKSESADSKKRKADSAVAQEEEKKARVEEDKKGEEESSVQKEGEDKKESEEKDEGKKGEEEKKDDEEEKEEAVKQDVSEQEVKEKEEVAKVDEEEPAKVEEKPEEAKTEQVEPAKPDEPVKTAEEPAKTTEEPEAMETEVKETEVKEDAPKEVSEKKDEPETEEEKATNEVAEKPKEEEDTKVSEGSKKEEAKKEEAKKEEARKEPAEEEKKVSKPAKEESSLKNESAPEAVKSESSSGRSMRPSDVRAMFPELEVVHPLTRLPEIDTYVMADQQQRQALLYQQHASSSSASSSASAAGLQALQGMSSLQALQALHGADASMSASVSQMLAQSIPALVKWPKEPALEARLQHIVHAFEKGEWPVSRHFSVYGSVPQLPVVLPPGVTATIPNSHLDMDLFDSDRRDGSSPHSLDNDVITITTDHGGAAAAAAARFPHLMKKRKRHIAIDVETERAKLHALLNSSNAASHQGSSHLHHHYDRLDRHERLDRIERLAAQQHQERQLERQFERQLKGQLERHQQQLDRERRKPAQSKQSPMGWDNSDEAEEARRLTPVGAGLQPPPAHQQAHQSSTRVLSMPFDLSKFPVPTSKPKAASTPTPPSAGSPASGAIDLSGGPPKKGSDDRKDSASPSPSLGDDEAQDFSMGKKRKSSKLDDILGKVMQKRNVVSLSALLENPILTDRSIFFIYAAHTCQVNRLFS